MIKVGIYGSATLEDPVRKQLLRLLLRHPDVDLRSVASPAGNTMPIAELYPVYAGETDLTLERVLDMDKLDVLFIIDEDNLGDDMMAKFIDEPEFRLIILGKAPKLLAEGGGEHFVYGLPEYNRKALVRGARGAVSPRPEAMITELALLPLAKNNLLPAEVKACIATPNDINDAMAEAGAFLSSVQPSFPGTIVGTATAPAPYDRIDLEVKIDTPIAIEEIERMYRDGYDDHNFVYVIPGAGTVDEDLRGSNKCLLRLNKEGDTLTINASMDVLTKGCTGNAVHIMDLLFGLHERTGLSI